MTVDPMMVTPLHPDRYNAECSEGHAVINAPGRVVCCPVLVKGEPCPGTLRPFGPNARKAVAS